jgi:hypothetical protein
MGSGGFWRANSIMPGMENQLGFSGTAILEDGVMGYEDRGPKAVFAGK